MLIYLFKFFTGHWQKPVCGRISNGWGKRRKWKLKNCFHFPPSPIFFLFSLFWPRARKTAVFNFDNVEDDTTYYTLYSMNYWTEVKTNLLLQHTTKTEKRNEKPDVYLEEKTKKRIAKVYKKLIFFYLMIFPFTLK